MRLTIGLWVLSSAIRSHRLQCSRFAGINGRGGKLQLKRYNSRNWRSNTTFFPFQSLIYVALKYPLSYDDPRRFAKQ
jgi:hypothetical protein